MVSEVLQEEREKDGLKGVARKNGRRRGRVRMVLGLWPVGREKVGAGRERMVNSVGPVRRETVGAGRVRMG